MFYQIALHGRQDIGLAPDDYAGFTMTLLRMLAFMPEFMSESGAFRAGKIAAPVSTEPACVAADLKKKLTYGDWNTLVSKDFLEVLEDIAPEAVAQARAAGGLKSSD